MSFIFPLFANQEPLIATALFLQGDKQTIEDGADDEADRSLKIFWNLMICFMYFIRETFNILLHP